MNKKMLQALVTLVFVMFCSGCTVRTYTVMKDRVDQELPGNRGFFGGGSPPQASAPKKQRRIIVIEIEKGSPIKPKSESKTEAPQEEGYAGPENLGYVIGTAPQKNKQASVSPTNVDLELGDITQGEPAYSEYEVKTGDTLQKISKQFYGTYKNWNTIFQANKEKIKDPNGIRPGLKLLIPKE
jgi:nucleoid-associated protein YgaU